MAYFDVFLISSLALFLLVFAGRTAYLLISKHINPITLRIGKNRVLGIIEISLFVAVNLWAVEVIFYSLNLDLRLFPWPLSLQLIHLVPLQVLGAILIVLGFVVCILALASIGDSWRLGIDDRRPGKLVTTGIYALCRNPIYVFFDLYFIGTFLVNGALIFLLFALFVTANLHYQILEEERFLTRVHGPTYLAYRTRTGRYMTWRRQPQRAASTSSDQLPVA